jgi:hypothetical protein
MALSDEQKSKLLARLKEGRDRIKKMREEAKAAGKPDPKPRKPRAKKIKTDDGALENPAAAPADNSTIAPIDGAPPGAVNAVAAKPVDPGVSKTKPIDVPNLPGEGKEVASKKDIVKEADRVPEAAPKKGIASAGVPKKYISNEVAMNEETGNQMIETNMPGQKESIKKALAKNKEENKPLAPSAQPDPPSKTVRSVKKHVPDAKAVETRAPFSMSALRKILYQ